VRRRRKETKRAKTMNGVRKRKGQKTKRRKTTKKNKEIVRKNN